MPSATAFRPIPKLCVPLRSRCRRRSRPRIGSSRRGMPSSTPRRSTSRSCGRPFLTAALTRLSRKSTLAVAIRPEVIKYALAGVNTCTRLTSWLNAVEGFFAKLTRRHLKRGVFPSLVALQEAINRFIEHHNHAPRPFTWKADPKAIIAAAKRGHPTLETIH
jgi:hypothetical protein